MGVLLSALIASILYAFNWHTFYDTRAYQLARDAEQIAADIGTIHRFAAKSGASDTALRSALSKYIGDRRPRIDLSLRRGEVVEWTLSNGRPVDHSRTAFERSYEIELGEAPEAKLRIAVEKGVRPGFFRAIGWAWTFSLVDYLEDGGQRWSREQLYNRSLPLYGYLLTILLVGFGTIRALHRDQNELLRVRGDASRITGELSELRERYREDTRAIRQRVSHSEAQRGEALRERDRLLAEIEAVENEYGDETRTRTTADEPLRDERLRAIAERKSRIERELAAHEERVGRYERELQETTAELKAAEELLLEVESKHDDLVAKLKDRNRQIRQLQELVQRAQRDAHEIELGALRRRVEGASGERSEIDLERIEALLLRWTDAPGEARVNFSKHSKAGMVAELFDRLDRRFVDRFFSHVTNPEYDRGARRSIRVVAPASSRSDAAEHGELIVVLDDDAGRTLGLRFDLVKDAPDPSHVGFALALLLVARTRALRNYSIRAR